MSRDVFWPVSDPCPEPREFWIWRMVQIYLITGVSSTKQQGHIGSSFRITLGSRVRGCENPEDPNPFILLQPVALFLGVHKGFFQSGLDVLTSGDYWVLRGKFLRTARRDRLIRNVSSAGAQVTKAEGARVKGGSRQNPPPV